MTLVGLIKSFFDGYLSSSTIIQELKIIPCPELSNLTKVYTVNRTNLYNFDHSKISKIPLCVRQYILRTYLLIVHLQAGMIFIANDQKDDEDYTLVGLLDKFFP